MKALTVKEFNICQLTDLFAVTIPWNTTLSFNTSDSNTTSPYFGLEYNNSTDTFTLTGSTNTSLVNATGAAICTFNYTGSSPLGPRCICFNGSCDYLNEIYNTSDYDGGICHPYSCTELEDGLLFSVLSLYWSILKCPWTHQWLFTYMYVLL